jgi:pimeloyl-ACP methyl ester carboxylesterase
MDAIDVDGLHIAYERVGTGPALLLLHGFVGDGRTTWRRQMEDLADEFTLVAWDAPGAGQSSDPPEDIGMAGYADCLAAFVAALDIGPAHVAGLSFGGTLALELHRRHGHVTASLVLISAYAGWAGSLPPDVAEGRLARSLQLSEVSAEDFRDALLPTMFSAGTPRNVIDEFGAAVARFRPIGFRAMARAAAEDLRGALPAVRIPTLLIAGADDVRAPVAVAEGLHAAIPGSVLTVLPATGHVCTLEAPGPVNRAMRGFLRGHSAERLPHMPRTGR